MKPKELLQTMILIQPLLGNALPSMKVFLMINRAHPPHACETHLD